MEENNAVPALPAQAGKSFPEEPGEEKSSKGMIGVIIAVVVVLLLVIVAAVFLLRADNETTGRVRDVFIIFMALESIVLGVAMIILIVQLATLINLLQNDIKPIIRSTSETVNTLKGTVTFLSDNLSEPVIKMNVYLAGLKQFTDLLKPRRPKR
jgi:heme/copper-type cytochrome/quinol oxidase subunit 2